MKSRTFRNVTAAIAASAVLASTAGCGAPGAKATSTGADTASPSAKRVRALEIQDAIARCMRDAGFEYEPWEPPKNAYGTETEEPVSNADDGYGAVLAYEKKASSDQDANPYDTYEYVPDPNSTYATSLSPTQQTRYYQALWGDTGGDDQLGFDEGEQQIVPLSKQGCTGNAQLKVTGGKTTIDSPEAAEHKNDLDTAMKNDPALAGATQAWAACVAERIEVPDAWSKFEFTSPDVMRSYVNGLIELARGRKPKKRDEQQNGEQPGGFDGWGGADGGLGGPSFGAEPWEQDNNQSVWTFTGKGKKLTEKQLGELRTQELKVWNADQKCQKTYRISDIKQRITDDFLAKLNNQSGK